MDKDVKQLQKNGELTAETESAPSLAPTPTLTSTPTPAPEAASPTATAASAPTLPRQKFPLGFYKAALFAATMIWGLSFFILKNAVDVVPPAQILCVRFLICGVVMALIFWRRMREHLNRQHILHGCALGALLFIAFWFQTVGLVDTTPGKNAFLTATYCILVPFVWWIVAKRRPTAFNMVAALACVVGIGLVSLSGDGSTSASATALTTSTLAPSPSAPLIGKGDALTLVAAVFYAVHIVYVAKVSPGKDIFVLTAYQFLAAGILALLTSAATEPSPANIVITWQLILEVSYLTFFASLAALLIQNVALQYVPPAQASLILSLESVFGMLFSIIFFGERLTLLLAAGFALIFAAIVLSESGASFKEKWTKRPRGGKSKA